MRTQKTLDLLWAYESRNVTFMEADGSWPIVWERAKGVHVWDADGKKYLDLTAAFGVAAAGHANPRVIKAGQKQMATLLHAMGDVHPHALKAQLAQELSRITFERWGEHSTSNIARSARERQFPLTLPSPLGRGRREERESKVRAPEHAVQTGKTIFCNSGSEAVEAALKTAMLATGKPGVIAFSGAYHGLGYGALNATHREHFKSPFRSQLREFGHFVPFPACDADLGRVEESIARALSANSIRAVLVEPVQVRGGINIPPREFLPMLRALCTAHGALLILDEIYTGFGRTGKWFACEHSAVVPDLICLGKALTGGFPLSACVGRADLMDAAWPPSSGEAIHTSTFLGHPVGCAMGLAQIREIETRKLIPRCAELGRFLLAALSNLKPQTSNLNCVVRGLGLLVGADIRLANGVPATEAALKAIKVLLHRGFIFLPEGEHSNVISFTPPLTISESQIRAAVAALGDVLTS